MTQHPNHECAPEHAAQMLDWIHNRGGVAVWSSINLSNPGASWSTPVLTKSGELMSKPTWEAEDRPSRVIKDASLIDVVTRREVKRFRVAVRLGGQGLTAKVTTAGTKRIRAEVDKAGEGASYCFDYGTQEAVITVPDKRVPLNEWDIETGASAS